ncbi:protein-L-isoaspartate O-methyltransferase [Sulfolobales archaeon HS-7]|nr:protein-L-isoaspartate O-methyltransferase [Sulfolobales archaeon HS-7]
MELRNKCIESTYAKLDVKDYLPKSSHKYINQPEFFEKPIPITNEINMTALSLGLYMLDQLEITNDSKVLEIGTGAGFYTDIIAGCTNSQVFSMEIDKDVYSKAKNVIKSKNVSLIHGDGGQGFQEGSPFDRIIAWALFPAIPCIPFTQLKRGGIIIAPIQVREKQILFKIIKGETVGMIKLGEVIFTKAKGICGFLE